MKIVLNKKCGGFGLSKAAVKLYCELTGWPLSTVTTYFGCRYYTTDQLPGILTKELPDLSPTDRLEYIAAHETYHLDITAIERTDSDLIAVVETLGDAANTEFSNLVIEELSSYVIDSFDGYETIKYVC
jgi:hypothetical protein